MCSYDVYGVKEPTEILGQRYGKKIITSSDAHYLWDINERGAYIELDCGRENAAQALDAALAALKPGEALVVAGSLYLASELRPQLMRFKGKSEN